MQWTQKLIVFNKTTLVVEESIHVAFSETNTPKRRNSLDDDDDAGDINI